MSGGHSQYAMAEIQTGDVYEVGTREYRVKGMTQSGKVCLKTDDGITKWATISELTE